MTRSLDISTRTRERAAMICAIAASNPELTAFTCAAAALDIDPGSPAIDLAWEAWYGARPGHRLEPMAPARDAEAEAMLRTGWTPERWTP